MAAAAEPFLKLIGRSWEDVQGNDYFEDAKGEQLKITRHNTIVTGPWGDMAVHALKDMDIRDDDIILHGYPKTGCHWTYEIISMILRRNPTTLGKIKWVGFMELASPDFLKAQPSPRILNSHIGVNDMPDQMMTKKPKVVLTIRNPKDTLVSFYNHHVNFDYFYGYKGTFEDYFDMHLEGKVDSGCYFEFYMEWQRAMEKHKDLPVLVLSYEDMKEDLPREVRKLAKFLEVDLDDDLAEAIAKTAGFESMTKMGHVLRLITRKGEVGDWKNWFTVAQNEKIDAIIADKMKDLTIYKPRYSLP